MYGKNENYPKESTLVMTKVEELNNIGPGYVTTSLTLVLKDGESRDCEANNGF